MNTLSPPALLDREARGIHAGLKAILSRDVWGNYREADFQRKNLRRKYLHLLLLYPSSKEAKDAGTHLWMQTSYAFIAAYKQRLSRVAQNNNNNNVVENRKQNQRFRQFLAEEERFWQALVLRVQRTYDITLPTSVPLPPELSGVGVDEEAAAVAESTHSPERPRKDDFGFPMAPAPEVDVPSPSTAASILSKALICLGDIARYREQYRPGPKLPPHLPEPKRKLFEHKPNYARARMLYLAAQALSPGEGNAAHQLAILAGYEGDTLASVTWYLRALCVPLPFETAGENLVGVLTKALGHAQAKAVIEGIEREQDLERDEESEPLRARVERFKRDLVLLHAVSRDHESLPTIQLALSKHAARVFGALVSARALPEEMIVRVGMLAQGGLWVILHPPAPKSKAADDADDTEDQGSGKGKDKEKRRRQKHRPAPAPIAPPASPEQLQQHLAHLLRLHIALLEVGIRELGEVDVYVGVPAVTQQQPPAHGGVVAVGEPDLGEINHTELAERITAVFRRTLPALRVGSKWLLANWGLVDALAAERDGAVLQTFWGAYSHFLEMLGRIFPEEELPGLTVVESESEDREDDQGEQQVDAELELEEDLDMRGWLPLQGLMGGPLGDVGSEERAQSQVERHRHVIGLNEEVHPNVEHLMRIRDLLRDGRKIAGMQGSPLALYSDKFVATRSVHVTHRSPPPLSDKRTAAPAAKPRLRPTLASIRDSGLAMRHAHMATDDDAEADAMTEQTSRTADDILHEAFSFLDNPEAGAEDEGMERVLGAAAGYESDEDEIVWDPRGASTTTAIAVPPSPIIVPTARTSPKAVVRPPPIPISPPSKNVTTTTPSVPPGLAVGAGAATTPTLLRTAQVQLSSPSASSPAFVSASGSGPASPGTGIGVGMQVPATTALDLLNNVLSKTAPKPPVSVPPMPISPIDALFLRGSAQAQAQAQAAAAAAAAGPQSIWSAARDEQGLGPIGPFSGSAPGPPPGIANAFPSTNPGQPFAPAHPPGLGHPHQQHQHQHQRFASQDVSTTSNGNGMLPSSQSTIWSSSQPSQPFGQHYNVPVGVPATGQFPISTQLPPLNGSPIVGHAHAHQQHHRAVSSSMAAAQLFGKGYGAGLGGPLSVSMSSPALGGMGSIPSPIGSSLGGIGGLPGMSPVHMHAHALQQDPGVFYTSSPLAQMRQNVNPG
ncbi:hypothetical protein HMN09_00937800 [Mycena chlorophos]|uniref:Protein SMG7 n=1 Tax=Mycena chlorophos TaxID=658473 RepID=A0A8H6SJF4_MYCCL|nr:hypothetical protein HMN09_00937800 [Mycena chlorophos]